MLNGLAGYIFGRRPGAGGTLDTDDAITAGRIVATNANETLEEEEWILVNTEEKSERGSSDEIDLITVPSSTESSGSASPVTTVEALGWNITPPPCFIVSQQRSVSKNRPAGTVVKLPTNGCLVDDQNGNIIKGETTMMEISIFENLLIEHPSMSVYHRRSKVPIAVSSPKQLPLKPQGPTTDISQAKATNLSSSLTSGTNAIKVKISDVVDDDHDDHQVVEASNNEINDVARRNYVDFFHFFGGASLRYDVVRAATLAQQRVERAAKAKDLGTNRLRRKNRTTYDASSAKGKQRKDRMKNFSGRSNDRKCQ